MTRIVFLFSVLLIVLCLGCDQHNPATETPATETPATETPATETPATETPATEAAQEDPVKTISSLPLRSDSHSPLNAILLQDPVELKLYETPSQALQKWYDVREMHPALLLYSHDPLLQPTNTQIRKNLLSKLANQEEESLRFDITNPAILPTLTVDAALQTGFFSAFYWVFPSSKGMETLTVEVFRSQMIQSGYLSQEEAQTLTLHDGVFSGMVRGLPFYAAHSKAAFKINGPVAFHLDLSYFSPLYEGEFKTPLFNLVYETFNRLQEKQLVTVAASFSYSQISGRIPLGSRFLGDISQQLFKEPQLLGERLPASWQQRANALYLPNMFITEETRQILLQMADLQPDDASVHYALYQVSRESKANRAVALRHLADAVQRDSVYAYEYLLLAALALEKKRPDEAVRVLRLASESNPENPFMTLEYARALLSEGQTSSAIPLLEKLLSLNWSQTFYPDMSGQLEKLLAELIQ